MTTTRYPWRNTLFAKLGACVLALGGGACAASPAAIETGAPRDALSTSEAVILVSEAGFGTDSAAVAQVSDLLGDIGVARRSDGDFVHWRYRFEDGHVGNVAHIVGVREVKTARTIADLGGRADPAGYEPIGSAAAPPGCDLIDAQRLRVPRPSHQNIALCRTVSGTDIVIYSPDGAAETMGRYAGGLQAVSTSSDLHAAAGTLFLLTTPDASGNVRLLRYRWTD